MSNLAVTTGVQQLDATLRSLTTGTVEDRAAAYALLHRIQLLVNRALRPVKDELIVHMEGEGIRKLGPLSVSSSAIDPTYTCNEPGNWDDAMTQDAMDELFVGPLGEYVKRIPAHYEIDTAKLGADVHAGIPAAKALYAELNARGWRREAGRRLSLKVDEPKAKREDAAA